MRIIETEVIPIEPDEVQWKDDEEIEEMCCALLPTFPKCETHYEPWTGYEEAQILAQLGIYLDSSGRDYNGRYVELRHRGTMPCGVIETTAIDPEDPCDCGDFDFDHWDNAQIINPNSSVTLFIVDNLPGTSYTFTLDDSMTQYLNFSFDESGGTQRVIEVTGNSVELYASVNACGPIKVICTCGDRVREMLIVTSSGRWQTLPPYIRVPCSSPRPSATEVPYPAQDFPLEPYVLDEGGVYLLSEGTTHVKGCYNGSTYGEGLWCCTNTGETCDTSNVIPSHLVYDINACREPTNSGSASSYNWNWETAGCISHDWPEDLAHLFTISDVDAESLKILRSVYHDGNIGILVNPNENHSARCPGGGCYVFFRKFYWQGNYLETELPMEWGACP